MSFRRELPRERRVHITFDIETKDQNVGRELPFTVGVCGDFSGNPLERLEPLSEREFTRITRHNFDQVMKEIGPELNFRVQDTIADDGGEINVRLQFNSLNDFEPAEVAKQVEPIRKLLKCRNRLRELLSSCDVPPQLTDLVEQAIADPAKLESLQRFLLRPNRDEPDRPHVMLRAGRPGWH